MKGAPSERTRLLEGRVTCLERRIEEVRDTASALVAHMAFLTGKLDAVRADNRRGEGAVLGTESVNAG